MYAAHPESGGALQQTPLPLHAPNTSPNPNRSCLSLVESPGGLSDCACVPDTGRSPIQLLIVDDDPASYYVLTRLRSLLGCQVTTARSLAEARVCLARAHYDVVLLSLMLADECGSRLLPELPELAPHTAVIILSPIDDDRVRRGLLQQGACDYVRKPCAVGDLTGRIARARQSQGPAVPAERAEGASPSVGGRGRECVSRHPHLGAAIECVARALRRVRHEESGAHA